MEYTDIAPTEEQIVAMAEKRATTNRGMRLVINRIMKGHTQYVSEFNCALRRVNKLERANGELSPLEYAYAINYELTRIVNEKY